MMYNLLPFEQAQLATFSKEKVYSLSKLASELMFTMLHKQEERSCRVSGAFFTHFCHNVVTKSAISTATVYLALKYVQRIKEFAGVLRKEQDFEFNLFLAALVLAHKSLEDCTYANRTWCQLSGLSLDILNQWETKLLTMIKYNTYVSSEEFSQWSLYIRQFERHNTYLNQPQASPTNGPPTGRRWSFPNIHQGGNVMSNSWESLSVRRR
ncbi:hypothetical protein K7432_000871 [Basidiobolus ranarum]|uniref:Cyclin N-terminal domain-containing protein n=1 Tax=Basidiobolus ranarum TaxID=34480 RepID=A0ABR2X3V8_9FUNG